jgi:FlaA1/EpsC-like NDP-sugar epimerase
MILFVIYFVVTMFWTSLLQKLLNRWLSRSNAILAANGALFVIAPVLSMLGHGYDHLDLDYALPQIATFVVMWLLYKNSAKLLRPNDGKWTSKAQKVAIISTGAIAFALVRWWMAPAPVHDQLVAAAATAKRDLPVKIDDVTTYRDVRVEGNRMIYIYDVTLNSIDTPTAQANLTKAFYAEDSMRKGIIAGVSYSYEYWNAGKLLSQFTITSCP